MAIETKIVSARRTDYDKAKDVIDKLSLEQKVQLLAWLNESVKVTLNNLTQSLPGNENLRD